MIIKNRIILFVILFIPSVLLAQESKKTSINWLTLSNAEILAKKSGKNMLLFFYRENCDFCEKMKNQTLNDPEVINLINNNFFPVMLNGKSKKPIIYNGIEYTNEKSEPEDLPYFHDLFKKLVDLRNDNYYWPTIVIVNGKHKKIIQGSGFWPKVLTLRNLKQIIH